MIDVEGCWEATEVGTTGSSGLLSTVFVVNGITG